MTTPRSTQGGAGRTPFRRGVRRSRVCFCKESTVDYKDVSGIRRFITDRGQIEAGKKAGNCAKCQRTLTTAIKRARHLALLPYAPDHLRVTGSVSGSGKISDDEDEATKDVISDAVDSTDAAEDVVSDTVDSDDVADDAEVEDNSSSAAPEETETLAEDVSTDEATDAEEDK